jgi:hypothetical protein
VNFPTTLTAAIVAAEAHALLGAKHVSRRRDNDWRFVEDDGRHNDWEAQLWEAQRLHQYT